MHKQENPPTVVYWGQNGRRGEGSLRETCEELGYHDVVILSGVTKFGFGGEPVLDLGDHCNPQLSDCSYLSRDIRFCQRRGISVFLSIGGDYDGEHVLYHMESKEVAQELADYLWRNFLGGFSPWRPLGEPVMDGIDFDIQGGGTDGKWDVLADELKAYGSFRNPVRLSAAALCSIPDPYLDPTIRVGAFDYIWVKFFGDETCEYGDNADNLLASWSQWSSYPGVNKLFLGLPGIPSEPGYVSREAMFYEILPRIVDDPRFGGVMLWSRVLGRSAKVEGFNTTTATSTTSAFT